MANARHQALEELLGWWVEQGGEPGDARGIADWLWLNASLNGRQLPRRFLPAGGLPEAPVVELVAPEPAAPQPLAPDAAMWLAQMLLPYTQFPEPFARTS